MALAFTPGRYWGKLVSASLGTTKTNKPQAAFTFSIVGAINPADPEGELLTCANYERTVYRTITDKTKDWFWRDMDALCDAKGAPQLSNPSDINGVDLAGAELALECTHETYEGKEKERWNIRYGGGGPDMKPLEASEAARLDALFGRGKSAARPQRRADAPPPVTQATPEEVSAARTANGDIPF